MKQPAIILCTVGFSLGTGIASWRPGWVGVIIGLGVGALYLGMSRIPSASAWLTVAILLGVLRISVQPLAPPDSISGWTKRTQELELTVTAVRSQRVDSQQAVARITGGPLVLLTLPGYPAVAPGDVIKTKGKPKPPGNFSGFDYRSYLAKDGIHLTLYLRYFGIDRSEQTVSRSFFKLKQRLLAAVSSRVSEPGGSFLQGILLGDRSGIPDSLAESFRRTGTSHVLALSGYNISIILGMVVAVLGRKPLMVALAILTVGLFVLLVGPSPPVLRAALMGSLLILAQTLGRPALAVRICLITAAMILVLTPWALRYDVGWQLSFLATLGILWMAGPLADRMRRLPGVLREPLAVTVAAGLFTAPIIALTFGTTSLISPLTNLLVVPLIPWLMLGGTLTAATALLVPPLSLMVAVPTDWLTRLTLTIVESSAKVSLASVSLPPPAIPWLAATTTIGSGWLTWRWNRVAHA